MALGALSVITINDSQLGALSISDIGDCFQKKDKGGCFQNSILCLKPGTKLEACTPQFHITLEVNLRSTCLPGK